MFRLALALGMTVEELGERMSGRELSEWMAYDRLSPIGEERADLRAGIVSSVIANTHRTKGDPFKPQDFMPFLEKPRNSPEQAFEKLRSLRRKGAI